jgi:hypothetical protein
MASFVPVPDPITPSWLTSVLRKARVLTDGQVLTVSSQTTGAFNSHTQQLKLHYSDDAPPNLATNLIVKSNIPAPWAIEAGAEEVKFYHVAAGMLPSPPAVVPCYAAAYDAASGNSYLLLQDLSNTHAPPITRDQQLSLVNGVPSAVDIERVIDTLAHHHAYWWNHPLLATETFFVAIGRGTRIGSRCICSDDKRPGKPFVRMKQAGFPPISASCMIACWFTYGSIGSGILNRAFARTRI